MEKSGFLKPAKKQSKCDSEKVPLGALKRLFEPCFGLSETSCVQVKKLTQSLGSRSAARVAFTARPDLKTAEKVRRILLRLILRE